MTLIFSLPESEAFSPATVLQQKSSERGVNGRMAHIACCLEALKAPPMTQQEKAEHASKVAAVRFKDECKRKDLLSQ